MEFLWSVLRDYMVCIITCICFLLFLSRNRLTSRRTMNLFMLATISILFVIAGEIGERAYSDLTNPTTWRIAYSVLSYAFRPAIPFFIALIPLRNNRGILTTIMAIPLVLNAVLLCTAFFSNIVFSYTGANHFTRGPLGYFPFVIGGVYVLVLLICGLFPLKKGEYDETLICSTIVAVCTACIVVEYTQDMSGLLVAACIVSEVFYYIYFVINKYSHDALTDALLRSRLYQDVEDIRSSCAFIIFDINGLKHINDANGHAAGDHALTTFSKAAINHLPTSARLYRIGGDEFAIVYKNADKIQVSSLLTRLREETTKLPFGFSTGYAFFNGGAEFDEAYANADAMLYENKRAFWADYKEKTPDFEHR